MNSSYCKIDSSFQLKDQTLVPNFVFSAGLIVVTESVESISTDSQPIIPRISRWVLCLPADLGEFLFEMSLHFSVEIGVIWQYFTIAGSTQVCSITKINYFYPKVRCPKQIEREAGLNK